VKRRIAYPSAAVLVLAGFAVAIRWGVPGTVNGATILGILLVVTALVIVAKARREDENPVEDEPSRKPIIMWSQKPIADMNPRHFRDVRPGDVVFQVDGAHTVLRSWKFDGKIWQDQL
jgi:hypothetical protein